MKRRVFIAVNFNADVIKAIGRVLGEARAKITPDFSADMRFVPEKNWHLTVSFLGDQNEEGLIGTLRALKNATTSLDARDIVFDNLSYGPPGKHPRMLWLSMDKESSRGIGVIKERVEDELGENGVRFFHERRIFDGHITLARFDFSHEKATRLPILNQKINILAAVISLDLMESELRRDGAEYLVLQKLPLSGDK